MSLNQASQTPSSLSSLPDAHAILMNAPMGIFTSTPDGRFISANPAQAQMLGYADPEELVAFITDIATQIYANPADREKISGLMEKSGKVVNHECLFRRQDGSEFWVSMNVHAVINTDGLVEAFQVFTTDITARKQAEEKLLESEAIVRTKLKAILEPESDLGVMELEDIIDVPAVRSLLESFHHVTGMLSTIVDSNGKVLVGIGWQDICTKFHRCHPETLKNCRESDTFLAHGAKPGTFKSYLCKNGMMDMASPITVGGRHMGSIYFGQFLYADEEPDQEQFRMQARRYGFDEAEYLSALKRVPRYDRQTVAGVLSFYSKLAAMISSLSFSSLSLARALAKQREAEESLRESEQGLRKEVEQRRRAGTYLNSIFNAIPDPFFIKDINHRWVKLNDPFCEFIGYSGELYSP
jgi:PAS domain S-box-containing protein